MNDNKIKVLAFGIIAEKIGTPELALSGVDDSNSLLALLEEKYPALLDLKFAIAVDRKLITENTELKSDCEVALLPPFSGG
jgi:molybdopterin converting factor small subunit